LFNAHYDERCFQPIHVYDTVTSRPVAVLLRPGKAPSGVVIRNHLRRLVRRIRSHWPHMRLTVRSDGHYGRPELMAWCEGNDVDYIFGLPGNAVLDRLCATSDTSYRAKLLEWAGLLRPAVLLVQPSCCLLDRMCWRRYDRVVAISETERSRIEAGGLPRAAVVQMFYPGIDVAQMRPSEAFCPYFLLAGRIMWTKNVGSGLAAFALACGPLGPERRLVVAGMADAKSQPYMHSLGLFAQHVGGAEVRVGPSDAEVRDFYYGWTAVLFTGFNEDWGLVPLEATAVGKAVIAVDMGGPRETVVHGQTGYLEPNDADAFVERMVELGSSPELARRMGRAGTERVRAFTWDSFVADIDRMVDELAATVHPGGPSQQPEAE